MEVGNLDDLIIDVWELYPNQVDAAIDLVATKYELDKTLAAHLIVNVWMTMNNKYPMNLHRYLVFETKFCMN